MSLAVKQNSWLRAIKYIPNGTQTYSKAPERYVNGVYPKMLSYGAGPLVFDEEGKEYFDYISSLGAVIVGHANPSVDDGVKESITRGEILLSLPHPKEALLAEKLCELIPNTQKVKFFKTGSEATSAAVRVARAYTDKTKVLTCGYNGWHDWCCIGYDRPAGVPEVLAPTLGKFKYNDLESIATHLREGPVAAIVLEPVIYDEPKDGFIEKLIKLAHKYETLVIFDEIVTGFRFGLSGVCGLFGVSPDLICLGKCLGNGYPISALCGPTEIMNVYERGDFFVSGTFGGDLIGISAALATLEVIRPKEIWETGLALKMGFNRACYDLDIEASCKGYAPRTTFEFPTIEHKALFWQECVKRGVLFGHANFVTMSHKQHAMNKTLDVCWSALKTVKEALGNPGKSLEGAVPVGVFR